MHPKKGKSLYGDTAVVLDMKDGAGSATLDTTRVVLTENIQFFINNNRVGACINQNIEVFETETFSVGYAFNRCLQLLKRIDRYVTKGALVYELVGTLVHVGRR